MLDLLPSKCWDYRHVSPCPAQAFVKIILYLNGYLVIGGGAHAMMHIVWRSWASNSDLEAEPSCCCRTLTTPSGEGVRRSGVNNTDTGSQ